MPPRKQTGKNGFALVLALVLMAFLLLLMLSFTALVQIEIQTSQQAQKLSAARSNALLGIQIGLAELSRAAGPDQRITARADILNSSDTNIIHPYWTGVWNGNPDPGIETPFDEGKAPLWLVSHRGNQPNPKNEVSPAFRVEILAEGTANADPIVVERVDLPSSDGSISGSYAWWIGDEGVKANIKVREPDNLRMLEAGAWGYLNRLAMAHRVGWTPLFGSDNAGPDNDPAPNLQQCLLNYSQVDLWGTGYDTDTRLNYYHDLTPYSLGILANAADGGLKLDLSRILEDSFSNDLEFSDEEPVFVATEYDPPRWGLLRSFYSMSDGLLENNGAKALVKIRPHRNDPDHVQHGVHPLIGMVQFNFIARASDTPSNPDAELSEQKYPIEILLKPIVVLVNPYNVELENTSYTVRVNVNMLKHSNNGFFILKIGDKTIDGALFHKLFEASKNDGFTVLDIPPVSFLPGQTRTFTLDPDVYPSVYSPDGGDGIQMTEGYNLIPYLYSVDSVNEVTHQEKMEEDIHTRLRTSNSQVELYSDDDLLQEVSQIMLSTTDESIHPLDNSDGLEGDYSWLRLKMRTSAQNILTRTGSDPDIESGARWLAHYNIRVLLSRPDPGHLWGYPDASKPWAGNPVYDSWITEANHTIDVTTPWLWGADILGPSGTTHVVLFDHPRHRPVSLGGLQHANVASESWLPAYAIGNSWASPYYLAGEEDFSYKLNSRIWDRFFFSTVEATRTELPDEVSDPLANSRLIPAPNADLEDMKAYDRVAANLLLKGAFNVNSTSVQAWSAVLRGLQGLDVEYWDPLTNSTETDSSAQGVPYPRTGVPAGNANEPWRGFRRLTEAQIHDLAEAIVAGIRERGPFLSMADFVNRDLSANSGEENNLKGLLQAAIDATDINASMMNPHSSKPKEAHAHYPEAAEGPRSTAAPGYLTQADILQTLDPVLAVRSDTFIIRAYGDARNPLSGKVESRVWCEAVVQRLPTFINSEKDSAETWPAVDVINQKFGRKFVIVAFRWLGPDDL